MFDLDVYCFGHVLFEISCGEESKGQGVSDIPPQVHEMIGEKCH